MTNKIHGTRSASASHDPTERATSYQVPRELFDTAKLALPMVLGQLGQIAMMATDLVLIARIGIDELAAAALASRIYLVVITLGMGLLAAIAPFAAQAFGAHNLNRVRRSLRTGLWAASMLSLPTIAIGLCGEPILILVGQPAEVARLAQQYLLGLAWGAAPALLFLPVRSCIAAVNRPAPILWITLAAIPMNALLVYLLTDGRLGLPRLGLFGAGLATTLVNCATFLAGLSLITMLRPLRNYQMVAHLGCFDWPLMRELIVIGAPISLSFLLESGAWSASVLLIGVIGTQALAAHQIAFQIAVVLLSIADGISMAATVRVAQAVGRNHRHGIKRAGLVAMLLGVVIIAILTLVVVVARFEIAGFFLGQPGAQDGTIGMAASLLLIAATSFVTAGLCSIATGGLRGMKDTRVPLLFAGISYWIIGFSLSYTLSLKLGLNAVGVWIGLSIGAAVHAALLVSRFYLLASNISLQAGEPIR
ncbi:MATE family efflux transporter [Bradyrhizobium sp. WSM1253]|uniref:MATE family efflux transporter n=1 Tax=Bradyrhizobium sp. WSM1253 TaxID=319003 RepID=UPI00025D269B|nr:MATE family efflux transporter [Bradyrhizobium sp. WSM1253]EIG61161.1 putative efflux protein, MATE family [Bradyrhizobium sp. WSM1253]